MKNIIKKSQPNDQKQEQHKEQKQKAETLRCTGT